MAKLALVHESDEEPGGQLVTTWAGAVEEFNKSAALVPWSTDGELRSAMAKWRSLPLEEQKVWERELAIAPLEPGQKTKFPMKGIIPIHLWMILDHFYPNFIKDEDFLDELFTTLGAEWANPLWHPKHPNDRRSRGPSTFAKNVLRILEDGSMVPLLKTLKYGDSGRIGRF